MKHLMYGFTLIELIIVFVIIASLTGVGFAAYTRTNNQQKLVNEANKLRDTLELAKRKAISNENSTVCTNMNQNYQFYGYRVAINILSSPYGYSLSILCYDTVLKTLNSVIQQTYSVDGKITFNSGASIDFSSLTGEAAIGSGSSPIAVTNTSTQKSSYICISPVGVIQQSSTSTCP